MSVATAFKRLEHRFHQAIMEPQSNNHFDYATYPVSPAQLLRSRGSTGRSNDRPLGREEYKSVKDSNIMTSRVLILCLLASAKGAWWTLEQPSSSLMERHPSFQRVLSLLPVRRLSMAMGDFGGLSRKATYLWSRPLVHHTQNLFWFVCIEGFGIALFLVVSCFLGHPIKMLLFWLAWQLLLLYLELVIVKVCVCAYVLTMFYIFAFQSVIYL